MRGVKERTPVKVAVKNKKKKHLCDACQFTESFFSLDKKN